jgi:hypothetical protein
MPDYGQSRVTVETLGANTLSGLSDEALIEVGDELFRALDAEEAPQATRRSDDPGGRSSNG